MEVTLFTVLIIVLVLGGFVGYFVIHGVTPALHTPLMAVTNAISGVVIVAAMLIAGSSVIGMNLADYLPGQASEETLFMSRVLGFLAVTFASINIFGGFAVTRRMLSMFKKKGK